MAKFLNGAQVAAALTAVKPAPPSSTDRYKSLSISDLGMILVDASGNRRLFSASSRAHFDSDPATGVMKFKAGTDCFYDKTQSVWVAYTPKPRVNEQGLTLSQLADTLLNEPIAPVVDAEVDPW